MQAQTASIGLSSHVLVLNRNYAAVRVTSVKRAFTLMFKGLAEIVSVEDEGYYSYDFDSWREVSEFRAQYEPDSHDWIRCVKFDLVVPRIVRLLFYDRLPRTAVKFNRRNLYARDRNRCQYCGKKFPTTELSLDHVQPRSRGGQMEWTNIVCACVSCNARKGGRSPAEAGMKLIKKPVRPKRSPVIALRLSSEKYSSWKHFLDNAYWNVELRN